MKFKYLLIKHILSLFYFYSTIVYCQSYFHILMEQLPECICRMAIDLEYTRPNCVGARIVLRPHDPGNPRQQWIWDGKMLKNRLNGYVITVNAYKQLVLGHPSSASTQLFRVNEKRILLDQLNNYTKHCIDTERKTGNPINTPMIVAPINPFTKDQLYDFFPATDRNTPPAPFIPS